MDTALSRAARLTQAFYAWERQGRGWQLWPHPVPLEPPFQPFRLPVESFEIVDDGRKHTAVGRWLRDLLLGPPEQTVLGEEADSVEPPEPRPYELVELGVAVPPDVKVSVEAAEHLLLSLSSCRHPVSFEIVATHDSVVVQIATSLQDAGHVRNQLLAYFPESVVCDTTRRLEEALSCHAASLVVDFGLSQEFMQPLRTVSKLDVDPLIAVVGAMSGLLSGETLVYQVLLQTAASPWRESVLRATSTWDGDDFFADAPELLPLAKEKVSRPLFAVGLRLAVQAGHASRVWTLARAAGGALAQFEDSDSNHLLALDNEDYPDELHLADVLARRTRRSGMILNSGELVSLVHLPSSSVRSDRLTRHTLRTKAAPATMSTGVVIGTNVHAGESRPVALSPDQRMRHTHVVGVSGTGKSTLLLQMAVQDMQAGHGLAVLDPHGDLIDELLCRVPKSREGDLILVDPADLELPVPFNVLAAHSDLEKTLLASDLVAVFRRLSTSWGDQMTSVLSNAVLAFLESTRGGHLADLRRFLIEPDFRRDFLATVTDPEVVYFWQKEFPLLVGRPQAPLLTRLDSFLRPKPVRGMVAQQHSLDFADVMNGGRILLVKLSQGSIGEENAALLGGLFVSKIQQTAIARQAIPEPERRPFLCYIDEFQSFITPSMASMLTGARKYRVGLVLAHQELRQMWNQDKDVAGAVLANAGTRICFRVGGEDAKTLEGGFTSFTQSDLQNLGLGQAVCRVDRADWDFSLETEPIPIVGTAERGRAARLVAQSRERYGIAQVVEETGSVSAPEPLSATATRTSGGSSSGPATSVRKATSAPTVPEEVVPVLPGRGGAQHKYLQELIRRWGEANGWRASVEKSILDGLGSVDVALERDGQSVACEICVTSTVAYEISNVQKCLAAGFDRVFTVISDARGRSKLETAVASALPEGAISVLTVDELFSQLEQLTEPSFSSSNSVRGYSVRVNRGQKASASGGVARTVANALKRLSKR